MGQFPEDRLKIDKKLATLRNSISYQSLKGANSDSRGPREEVKKREIIKI